MLLNIYIIHIKNIILNNNKFMVVEVNVSEGYFYKFDRL
jgi:hypothetical protein